MIILVDMDDTIEQLLSALVKRANERFHRSAAVDDISDWSIVCAQIPDGQRTSGIYRHRYGV